MGGGELRNNIPIKMMKTVVNTNFEGFLLKSTWGTENGAAFVLLIIIKVMFLHN